MSNNNPISEKKKALLAYKEKILGELQYYKKQIEDFRANYRKNCYYDDADSSDSDDYLPKNMNTGPNELQLKLQQKTLTTCLQATQELTNLTILQKEINVLVQDPQFDRERPVTEPGIWKEVTAECCVDLVPFSITFFKHTPDRNFAPTWYRGLKVSLVKTSHDVELKNSVLHTVRRPSDAVEVIRSYAETYRSRRTTLSRLADKYRDSLFLELHPEGGFVLKCADLIEILWQLENKWSHVAHFHHRMKIELEYMEESYVKIISQAHKQLLDPTIQTDKRTLLLSEIISTCLEARGLVDSEPDLESRETEIQTENEPKDKDSEIMVPPKSLPKKTKKVAKTKAVVPQKRSVEDESAGVKAKKMKTGEDSNTGVEKNQVSTKVKNVDHEENKKKLNEKKDMTKKKKNYDKIDPTNKENQYNAEDVVSTITNVDNINKNDKNETNQNIAKKKKNNDDRPEMAKTNNEDKRFTKSKSKEEIKRKNVETGESNPKKAKSSSNLRSSPELPKNNKKDEIGSKNKNTENGPNPKNNIRDDGSNKEQGNGVVENKESNDLETKINVAQKKLDRKTKMSIANDKKFDQVTKKLSDNNDNKISKAVENNQGKSVASTKDTNNIKETEVVTNNKAVEPQQNKNKKIVTIPKKIAPQNNANKPNQMNIAATKEINKIKNTRIVASSQVAEPQKNQNKEKDTVAVPKNANGQNNGNKTNQKNSIPVATDANKDKKSAKNNINKVTEHQKTKNKDKDINIVSKNAEPQTNINEPVKKSVNHNKKAEVFSNNKAAELKIPQHKEKNTMADPKNQNNNNPTLTLPAKNKNPASNKGLQTEKTVTEKNANTVKNKEQITNIKKVIEKINKDEPSTNLNKPEKKVSDISDTAKNIINKEHPKIITKSVRNITQKLANHQHLKVQNLHKLTHTKTSKGNTQVLSNAAERENGGKISKIPQKLSLNSEKNLNMLRISPRRLPLKFNSGSQDARVKHIAKFTNIPRFMKTIARKNSK